MYEYSKTSLIQILLIWNAMLFEEYHIPSFKHAILCNFYCS
jgi:hypothetical protein